MEKKNFDYRTVGHIQFTVTIPEQTKIPSFASCMANYLLHALYSVFHRKTSYPQSNSMLFVTQSINNIRTLTPITRHLKNKEWGLISVYDFPITKVYRYSLPTWIQFLRFYRSNDQEGRMRIRHEFQNFVNAPGFCKVYRKFLDANPIIKVLVVANDHTIPTRCLIETAYNMGVPVVYTQHASITEQFPPLHFAYSFLDGAESYEKYRAIGDMKGKAILLGSPRFDDVMPNRQQVSNTNRDAIGIGMNEMDALDKVLHIAQFIMSKTSRRVVVRPHPRSMASFDSSYFTKHGIDISDSSKESSFNFFTQICMLVANESGIHLDAAIFGIPSVLYNFSDGKVLDWYGYLRKGLTTMAETPDDVISFIEKAGPVSDKVVQYYYAAFHTKYDGHIAETQAAFLDDFLEKGENTDYLDTLFQESEPNLYIIK